MGSYTGGFRSCTVRYQFPDHGGGAPYADCAEAGVGGSIGRNEVVGGVSCPGFAPPRLPPRARHEHRPPLKLPLVGVFS